MTSVFFKAIKADSHAFLIQIPVINCGLDIFYGLFIQSSFTYGFCQDIKLREWKKLLKVKLEVEVSD